MILNLLYTLFIGHYLYTNVLISPSTNFNDMTSFIEKQQYREDQLREECNLHYYKIKEKPSKLDTMISSVKQMISYKNIISVFKNPKLSIKNTDYIHAKNIHDIVNISKQLNNINKQVVYNEITYTIVNNKPTWTIQLKKNTLTIINII